jgi:hypothetical protein
MSSSASSSLAGSSSSSSAGGGAVGKVSNADSSASHLSASALREKLDTVFDKAVGSVIGNINATDIDVGDMKGKNKLGNLLLNKLDKMEKDFKVVKNEVSQIGVTTLVMSQAEYMTICESSKIDNILRELLKQRNENPDGGNPLENVVRAVQSAELKKLQEVVGLVSV